MQCRDELIDYLDGVSEDESVKILVLVNSDESTGYEKFAEFYRMVGDRKISKNDVWRMFRTFDSLIKKKFGITQIFYKRCEREAIPADLKY